AEAADPGHAPAPGPGHPTFAGTVAGLGSGEVPRRTLTEAQIEQIVGAEISDRRRAALDFERAGRHDDAERLRRGAEALRPHLDAAHPDVTA
ncbi:MAG TPA: hypothetical protein VI854_06095, partial [Acidimicrobiia bacterium]|nr:hypothetical protein [Acidimicrobiia bacterium]